MTATGDFFDDYRKSRDLHEILLFGFAFVPIPPALQFTTTTELSFAANASTFEQGNSEYPQFEINALTGP
jgi:hypothetical protein